MVINLENISAEAVCQLCESINGCAYDKEKGPDACILLNSTSVDPEEDGVAPDVGDHEYYTTKDPKAYLDSLAANITILGASYSTDYNADPLMAVKCHMAVEKIIELERLIDDINL